MVILITGASHTGKTFLAQRMLEEYGYPYLSVDHLKMGLIRSGNTALTPEDDEELTGYLWPIVREIIKTAVENRQNLIVEGCYIPLDWTDGFGSGYLTNIRCYCLVMTEKYIRAHFDDIKKYESVIEDRMYDGITMEETLRENAKVYEEALKHGQDCVLIDENYEKDTDLSRITGNKT